MEILVLLAIIVAVIWFVGSVSKGVSVARRTEEIKDDVREKAIRDAFIAAPGESYEEMVDRTMDNMAAAGMTIHDRSGLRSALDQLLPDQVEQYRRAVRQRVEGLL